MAFPPKYQGPDDLPGVIPVFPLAGAILLPRANLPLNIFEERYLAMIDDAMRGHRIIGMIQPERENDRARHPKLYPVGCAGRITSYTETGDGRMLIALTGIARFGLGEELQVMTQYRQIKPDWAQFARDFDPPPSSDPFDRAKLIAALKPFVRMLNVEIDWNWVAEAPADMLINAVAMLSPFPPAEKQALVEAADLAARAKIAQSLVELAVAGNAGDGRTLN